MERQTAFQHKLLHADVAIIFGWKAVGSRAWIGVHCKQSYLRLIFLSPLRK